MKMLMMIVVTLYMPSQISLMCQQNILNTIETASTSPKRGDSDKSPNPMSSKTHPMHDVVEDETYGKGVFSNKTLGDKP